MDPKLRSVSMAVAELQMCFEKELKEYRAKKSKLVERRQAHEATVAAAVAEASTAAKKGAGKKGAASGSKKKKR